MTILKELKWTHPGALQDIGDCLYMEDIKQRLCLAAAGDINVLGVFLQLLSDSIVSL